MLAETIAGPLDCDVHRIEPADPYPDDYAQTRERNVRERNAGAHPTSRNCLTRSTRIVS